jgi:AraC-like DNA-binding protein
MISARHETYPASIDQLPFILHTGLERTSLLFSKEQNWHDNLEFQLCTAGSGTVLLNGVPHPFFPDDVISVESNMIHYTFTETQLTYACLIVRTDFCHQMGFDYHQLAFTPRIRDSRLTELFYELIRVHDGQEVPVRTALLTKILLEFLLTLSNGYMVQKTEFSTGKDHPAVKETVTYLHNHYQQKITLEEISRAVAYDRYALCRAFRKLTGQTIFENLNRYRCFQAAEQLRSGLSVGEAAASCGFENMSFFTKTFKKYMGILPSRYKAERMS